MTGQIFTTSSFLKRAATHRFAPALVAVFASAAAMLPTTQAQARPAIVELFTSQGCSSCPPADALMNELATRPNIIALTYNITYWDYLGWRDTLGREEHTQRQEAYAQHFRDRKYTPQLVVEGDTHLPGSRVRASRDVVDGQVEKVESLQGLTTAPSDTGVTISSPATGNNATASVWLVQYDKSHEVEITRGENSGETITYSNVVREITRLEDWDMSKPLDMDITRNTLLEGEHDGCAIIIQQDSRYGVGPVVAATRVDMELIN